MRGVHLRSGSFAGCNPLPFDAPCAKDCMMDTDILM